MNRKTPILDPRSSVTPETIDLKFGMRDYIVGATQHAKTYNNRPSRDPPAKGEIYLYHSFFNLPSSREQTERHIAVVFAPNDVFRWGLISSGVSTLR